MAAKKETVKGKTVVTPKGRLSWPYLTRKNEEGEYPSGKFETKLLIPKDADISALKAAVMAVAQEAFGDKIKSLADLGHNPLTDGDGKGKENAGCWSIRPKSNFKPGIVDRSKNNLTDEDEVFSGQFARLSVTPFSFVSAGKPGVTFSLENVQIIGGGERFGGGGRSAQSDFDEFQDEVQAGGQSAGAGGFDDGEF